MPPLNELEGGLRRRLLRPREAEPSLLRVAHAGPRPLLDLAPVDVRRRGEAREDGDLVGLETVDHHRLDAEDARLLVRVVEPVEPDLGRFLLAVEAQVDDHLTHGDVEPLPVEPLRVIARPAVVARVGEHLIAAREEHRRLRPRRLAEHHGLLEPRERDAESVLPRAGTEPRNGNQPPESGIELLLFHKNLLPQLLRAEKSGYTILK